jgi:hypothetical protein
LRQWKFLTCRLVGGALPLGLVSASLVYVLRTVCKNSLAPFALLTLLRLLQAPDSLSHISSPGLSARPTPLPLLSRRSAPPTRPGRDVVFLKLPLSTPTSICLVALPTRSDPSHSQPGLPRRPSSRATDGHLFLHPWGSRLGPHHLASLFDRHQLPSILLIVRRPR